ncbi:hypothetical protein LINGRAPRIM_LOCUS1899 [Linum grandiflorum]
MLLTILALLLTS